MNVESAKGSAVLRSWLTGLTLLIASSVISLALLEGMIRVFFPAYDPSGQIKVVVGAAGIRLGSPNQRARQSKNTGDYDVLVSFNAYGFRDEKDVAASQQTAKSSWWAISLRLAGASKKIQRFSNVLQTLLHKHVFNTPRLEAAISRPTIVF